MIESLPVAPLAPDWHARAATFAPPVTLLIDGAGVAPVTTMPDHTPRDGSLLGYVPCAGPDEVDAAVAAARRALDDGRRARLAPAARKAVLLRFAALVREHTDEHYDLVAPTWFAL